MATHLLNVLERAALDAPEHGLTFYDEYHPSEPTHITYANLLAAAKSNAKILLETHIVSPGKEILLHFDTHADCLPWFWSVIATGAIPVISTPLATDPTAKIRHLEHLQKILNKPKILTLRRLANAFTAVQGLDVVTVESITKLHETSMAQRNGYTNGSIAKNAELAFLMLTSGSTGNAKAVEERHSQVIAAVRGKIDTLGSAKDDVFLNWIGSDHVACITEMHLHAMMACATEIHVTPLLMLKDPLLWPKLMEKHGVTHSFSPNFFLSTLSKTVENAQPRPNFDLSKLRRIVSGGEANVVSTGITFNRVMHSMGAPENTLVLAFGMTETCGACNYHLGFPSLENKLDLQFCSVGRKTFALNMRITDDDGNTLGPDQDGNLELSGPCVFKAYYNDSQNTQDSFTTDGWFKTGDKGTIDAMGNLVLSGRVKDSIIINGVKYFSHELEFALEENKLEGLTPSYTAAFSTWPKGSDSEELIICFLPTQKALDDERTFATTIDYIAKTAVLYCAKKPLNIVPLPADLLPKSALGKLSRPKLKKAYEEGKFDEYKDTATKRMAAYRKQRRMPPTTDLEQKLVEIFAEEFELELNEVGINDSLVDMGVDSLRLFRFKNILQRKLDIPDVPMTVLLMHPGIKEMATAIDDIQSGPKEYSPVVTLQNGDANVPPIWFLHPGLGEVLVFLNLSKYFSDRKVYGIRAPGFNPGEKQFETFDQMIDTYAAAVMKTQQHGPYVVIGYSYGGVLAFEIAKRLEAAGEEVAFLASLNLPPFIKEHMRQLDWCELFLTLTAFLGFITEEQAYEWDEPFHKLPKEEVMSRVMKHVDPAKLSELDLSQEKLDWWAGIAEQIQGLARNYDPSGSVACMDVFYAVPIYRISPQRDKQGWLQNEMMNWTKFSRTPVRYHDSPGTHHTMVDPENVFVFQKILREAMRDRGVL